MRVGLVSCVKSKRTTPAAAAELYTSSLFRGARAAVEASCDRWFILSALHGLVAPETLLEPYEKTLTTASVAERREWADRVLGQVFQAFGRDLRPISFEIHAGRAYEGFGLTQGLRRAGAVVELPLDGLTQGRRLAWYKQHGYL
jgi:hypothetical protein